MRPRHIGIAMLGVGLVLPLGGSMAQADDKEKKEIQQLEQEQQQEQAKEAKEAEEEACAEQEAPVGFNTGSASLNAEDRAALDKVAAWAREDDSRWVRVEGYTDPVGTEESNLKLSTRRVQTVENYLHKEGGLDVDRVKTFSRGEEKAEGAAADAPSPEMRIAVIGVCGPGEAAMEEPAPVEEPAPAPMPAPTPVVTAPAEPAYASQIGIDLVVGGGVIGFVDSDANDIADVGGSWEVRAGFGTIYPVSLELAYQGSAQNLNAVGLTTDDGMLVGNGGEANLRLMLPFGILRPYIFGGVGWTHYEITDTDVGTSGLLDGDDVGVVPFGLGLGVLATRNFYVDVRATGRATWSDDMLNGALLGTGDSASLGTWNVSARLGAVF